MLEMKIKERKYEILFIIICILCVSFGQISLKAGVSQIEVIDLSHVDSKTLFNIITNKFIFLGLMLHAIIIPLWLFILLKSDISFAYPLISLSYLFTAILALTVLNEHITIYRWVGISIIVIGSYFIMKS